MGLKITAPDRTSGVHAGITFTDGFAEVDDLDVATFQELVGAGFIINGHGGPTAEELAAADSGPEND